MSLSDEFREIRRVSTPWCCVRTSDYRETIKTLLAVRKNGEGPPDAILWDCVNGPQAISGNPPDIGGADDPPIQVLRQAITLPAKTILLWVVPDEYAVPNSSWSNPFTSQAVANLRNSFKSDGRTFVILSTDGKLPPLISDDVPILEDPLPSVTELTAIGMDLCKTAKATVKSEDLSKAIELCRGMTRFSAEEAMSRKLRKDGIDLEGLATAQRLVIEQTSERGLAFENGKESFSDIGGLASVKEFSSLLFAGSRPPTVVVRIEEIEKAMGGSGSGGDTSGVSQDQLGVLLTSMEDNDWTGIIAVGHAGTGKSLISKAMGNTYKVPSLTMDLGAMMGQYVGQSQQKIRRSMGILKAFAGSGAFFVATSNDLAIIPPALRRRFRFGIWFFDLLSKEERSQVWQINLKRFGISADQPFPDDNDWTGSDIRNVCDLASRLRCPLRQAAKFIVPVAKSDPAAITRLRDAAHGKFLSSSNEGTYQKPEMKGRQINL